MVHLVEHAPRFSVQQAVDLAKALFGMTASADRLPSERDQNFLLRDNNGDQFVLKIANASETREVLALQNLTMTHVIQHNAAWFDGFDPCPRVCRTPDGEEILTIVHQCLPQCPSEPLGPEQRVFADFSTARLGTSQAAAAH